MRRIVKPPRPSTLPTLALAAMLLGGCLFTADRIDPASDATAALATSPATLFEMLVAAYESRSVTRLDALLADDYLFVADAASLQSGAEGTWGKEQEKERARRMFAAISEVRLKVLFDRAGTPEAAPRETTWTVYDMRMEMVYDGQPWEVASTRTEFRLRAETTANGTTLYKIVRWSDFD